MIFFFFLIKWINELSRDYIKTTGLISCFRLRAKILNLLIIVSNLWKCFNLKVLISNKSVECGEAIFFFFY